MEPLYSGTDELRVMANAVNYTNFLSRFIAKITSKPGPILDFGAGIGTFSVRLRNLGYDVHCHEPDEHLATELESLGFQVYRSIEQIEDQSYSAIYCLNVLEHIHDDRDALSKVISKLKHMGLLIVYVPAFPILYSANDARVGHYRRYRLEQVTSMLQNLGCVIETYSYIDSLGFLATLIYKWFGDRSGSVNPILLRAYDLVVFPISRVVDRLGARWLVGKNIMVTASRIE